MAELFCKREMPALGRPERQLQMATSVVDRSVAISACGVNLLGDMTIPAGSQGIILFAHGSGSSRLSPRNRYVSQVLQRSKLATVLFDLLTHEEEAKERYTGYLRFDIKFLSERLQAAANWVGSQTEAQGLPLGLFGASTGGAAALVAAAAMPGQIGAVVSRGGRPDLAGSALPQVDCPTLLIVGGADYEVLALNQRALVQLRCAKELKVIPGATHLFEEPGALEAVAQLAGQWFLRHL